MEIKSSNGMVILIDDADWPLIKDHTWQGAKGNTTTWYAMTAIPCGDGTLNKRGYPRYTTMRMHRLIMGAKPGQQIDHRNHNGLDNRRENLRFADFQTNSRNKRGWSASGFKGVFLTPFETYTAHIRHMGKLIHLGTFKTCEVAALAYNAKAQELFGEFASLNEVTS